jgi:hypothetical protein
MFIDRIEIKYKLAVGARSGKSRLHYFTPALNSNAMILQIEGGKQIDEKPLKNGFDSILIIDSPALNDKVVQEHLSKIKERIIQLSKC